MANVIWEDDLKLKETWHNCIEDCRNAYGTPDFIHAVECLVLMIPNLPDGPKLKDEIDKKKDELNQWKNHQLDLWNFNNPSLRREKAIAKSEEDNIKMMMNIKLFKYIIQILNDNQQALHKSGNI